MVKSLLKVKSFGFTIRLVELVMTLQSKCVKYFFSKHLLRTGTAIRALISDAILGESQVESANKQINGLNEVIETKPGNDLHRPHFVFRYLCQCLYIGLILIIITTGCENGTISENEIDTTMHRDSAVIPQIINLKDLPDSLQPKTVFLGDMPKPLSIRIPSDLKIDTSGKHPLFPEINLSPPNEIKAGFSIVMKNYTSEDGLAVDVTSCAFADSKGNLWFGTFVGGVSKYDGQTFTSYTTSQGLVSNEIKRIMEDREGNIWFGTTKGISKFDGLGFTTIGKYGHVEDILQDRNGTFWFATNSGLINYQDGEIARYTDKNGLTTSIIYCLKQDKKGNLWVGTDRGISVYNGIKFTHKDLEIDDLYKPVKQLVLNNDQVVWAASFYGFFKLDNGDYHYFPNDERANARPSLFLDSGGDLWISNEQKGVLKYDGYRFSLLNKSHGLVSDIIMDVVEDQSGNLWFGTEAGISKYSGNAVINYTGEQGLVDKSIRSILEDRDGHLWFAGNSQGICRFDKNNFLNFTLAQGLPSSRFRGMEKDGEGNIWLGSTETGLIKYDGTSFTVFTTDEGLANNQVFFIYYDHNGKLYIATRGGISVFDGASFTNYDEQNGLVNNRVSCIHKDKGGKFWFGTGDGVSCFDGNSFINYSGVNGPGDAYIKSILEDKEGNIWLGSFGQGIFRFDGKYFHQYTTENGLPDNTVTQVALSKDGDIVVGTNYGLGILQGFNSPPKRDNFKDATSNEGYHIKAQNSLSNSELARYEPVFEIFNSNTGYPIKDVNRGQRGIYTDKEGIMWIATGSEKTGLVRFDHNAIKKNRKPPNIHLTSIKVNNEKVIWNNLIVNELKGKLGESRNYAVPPNIVEEETILKKPLTDVQRLDMKSLFAKIRFDRVGTFYPIPQNLVLPYDLNNLTISFAAIEPSRPQLVQYQFWLEGYSRDWSTPSNMTSATFGNIFEGDYTFHVRAQSHEGVWSEILTYSFIVLPPWYRTWWAYLSYVLLFLFGLRVFSKYRERRLNAEKEKLELAVKQRTKELIKEKKKSDDLLLNILPEEIAHELKEKGRADARDFEMVSILFTDFDSFTEQSAKLSAQDLVAEINTCFKAFDGIIEKYGVEKIKTIGDSYMAAGGLPIPKDDSVKSAVLVALEMQDFIQKRKTENEAAGKPAFEMRVGIHTGPVVAGIVGVKKFQYDVWGDTVNTASRMETNGKVDKVNISQNTFELIKDDPTFKFEQRGKVEAKGKGFVEMYFVSLENDNFTLSLVEG